MRKLFVCLVMLALCSVPYARAAEAPAGAMEQPSHMILTPGTLHWMPVPPVLPRGAQMAVLAGDPSKEGVFVLRVRMPANYKFMPHWHPTQESFTVVSGQMFLGTGDKFDKSKAEPVPTGGFASIPALHHHFAFTEGETVIDLVAYGPFQIYYVNPADSPQKMAEK
jgi:hypothetical protein